MTKLVAFVMVASRVMKCRISNAQGECNSVTHTHTRWLWTGCCSVQCRLPDPVGASQSATQTHYPTSHPPPSDAYGVWGGSRKLREVKLREVKLVVSSAARLVKSTPQEPTLLHTVKSTPQEASPPRHLLDTYLTALATYTAHLLHHKP